MSDTQNILEQLMDNDDITWQSMLFELVKTEQMDPWDIDISSLAEKFILMINEMKETNLKIGGKVILASTILLRLKSGRFIDTDLAQLEALISSINSDDSDFEEWEDLYEEAIQTKDPRKYKIYPRTPQPRQRKVSVFDLVGALEEVIEKQKIKINVRKFISRDPVEVKISSRDINIVIKEVFQSLNEKSKNFDTDKLKFSQIIPSNRKEDLISTFLPLLHLTNQRVTDLFQEEAFGDFDIHLLKKGMTFEELSKIQD